VVIVALNYRGTDALNEADEYVDLRNAGNSNVQLLGWYMQAQSNGVFVPMPALTLRAGQTCRIFTANPQPFLDCGANGFGKSYLWSNTADTVFILDASFRMVNAYSYPQ